MRKDNDDGFYSEENMRAIRRSLKLEEGKVVIKTMEELEQMAAEPESPTRQSAAEEPTK